MKCSTSEYLLQDLRNATASLWVKFTIRAADCLSNWVWSTSSRMMLIQPARSSAACAWQQQQLLQWVSEWVASQPTQYRSFRGRPFQAECTETHNNGTVSYSQKCRGCSFWDTVYNYHSTRTTTTITTTTTNTHNLFFFFNSTRDTQTDTGRQTKLSK